MANKHTPFAYAAIPQLEPHCGSWVVVCRETGEAVMETFSGVLASRVRQDRFEVLTAMQWLARFNASIKGASATPHEAVQ